MKSVIITVRTLQRDPEGHEETIELTTPGTYEQRDDVQVLRYAESRLTNMEGTTTAIEVQPDVLVLTRTGTVMQQQEFRPGKTHRSLYRTPFGNLALGMYTHHLSHDLADGNGTISLGYDVLIDGVRSHYNELTISSREDGRN
ncbi:MAG: DUF1934 domain-containing protein [Veillonellaceae bacterium]|nr:DUF1934 domain-containing protein [Veillonellaceae bacterium]